MVACGKFALRFGKVERTTVTFSVACNEVYDEGGKCHDVTAEDVPSALGLVLAEFAETHRSSKANHGEHHHTNGELVADNLCSGTHGTDKGVFVVCRPSGEEDTYYADASDGKEEEHSDVEVEDLCTLVPGKAGEGGH